MCVTSCGRKVFDYNTEKRISVVARPLQCEMVWDNWTAFFGCLDGRISPWHKKAPTPPVSRQCFFKYRIIYQHTKPLRESFCYNTENNLIPNCNQYDTVNKINRSFNSISICSYSMRRRNISCGIRNLYRYHC